ncbi:MAG TPA: uracil-DNA glycosylase [Symbiobacteriaceae bacterium]
MATLAALLADLRAYPSGPGVFNPWRDTDPAYDIGPEAPAIRADQLAQYLAPRIPGARWLLVAEAIGFQGGRFSGIAMTSERILLGHRPGLDPGWVLPAGTPVRTSRPGLKPPGFNEPTATVVWSAMHEAGVAPTDFILWNTFPFHPYHPDRGPLTNRTPSRDELSIGAGFLQRMLRLCPDARVVAVGQKASEALTTLGVPCAAVRHPANGGAGHFRSGLRAIIAAGGV